MHGPQRVAPEGDRDACATEGRHTTSALTLLESPDYPGTLALISAPE